MKINDLSNNSTVVDYESGTCVSSHPSIPHAASCCLMLPQSTQKLLVLWLLFVLVVCILTHSSQVKLQ